MLLHVLHETAYDYVPTVRTAQHMAHLKPASTRRQKLLSHRLTVTPAPARQAEVVDIYGNTRSFFSLQASHDRLRVVADSLVSTAACEVPETSLPWQDVAERMRYHREARYDPASEFVFASPYVPRDAALAGFAQPSFAPGRPLLDA